ncbi:MAG: helix-turn-helix domain-containing protein, partial [Clostridia bacterium]|nr:helix-turn-helix domain-containing protein [Clostridia bacterium]
MGKHLTLDDRISIQTLLKEQKTFAEIARQLGKSPSTIIREIKKHTYYIDRHDVTTLQTKNACAKRFTCSIKGKCKRPSCEAIHNKNCKYCGGCNDYCSDFEEEVCTDYQKHYVCNGCTKKPRCPLSKYVYDAKRAQADYLSTLSESRRGPSVTGVELEQLNEVVAERLRSGQSVNSIFATDGDRINVSSRTVYKYLHADLLDVKPYHLQRMTRFRVRKKAGPPVKVDKGCCKGRTYDDFQAFMET